MKKIVPLALVLLVAACLFVSPAETMRTVVNDPPVVTTTAGASSYTQCDPATPVDSGVTVTDADNSTFASATISITNNLHSPEDILSFVNNSPTAFGDIQVDSYTGGF